MLSSFSNACHLYNNYKLVIIQQKEKVQPSHLKKGSDHLISIFYWQPLMLIVPDVHDVYTPLETDVIVQFAEV